MTPMTSHSQPRESGAEAALHTSLLNQVAVVTGAGSGIGKAISKALAAAGATLCLVGRNREKLEETADDIRTSGFRVTVSPTDLTLDSQVEQLKSRLEID